MKQPAFTPFGPEHADVAADARDDPGEPLLEGNQTDLFAHTEEVRAALVGTLDRAVDHINLDAALLHAPGLTADIIGSLAQRCRQGVRVQVIAHTQDLVYATDELARLCQAGITLNEVHPRRGWRGWLERNKRPMYRQLAVVDGQVAWCGPGIRPLDLCSFGPHMQVRGPIVERLQRLFLEAWHASPKPVQLPQADYFPHLADVGGQPMGLALPLADGAAPLKGGNSLVEQVERSRSHVFVSMVQRAPSRRLMKALLAAAASGVRVTVIMGKNAQGWRWNTRRLDLLGVGARVFRVDDTCPFPCHAVVDGDWASLALDGLDAKVGEGAELVVVDAAFAASVETAFHVATSHAVRLRARATTA